MKKIIDEKGRLFGRISIIDILVIIVAVVLVAAVYVKFHGDERTSTLADLETVTYTFMINGIREGSVDSVKVGDKIYNNENDVCIGTITGVQATESETEVQKSDGTFVKGSIEDRFDLLLTVEAQCQVIDGRIYSEGVDEINVNTQKLVYTKYLISSGKIQEIVEMK